MTHMIGSLTGTGTLRTEGAYDVAVPGTLNLASGEHHLNSTVWRFCKKYGD